MGNSQGSPISEFLATYLNKHLQKNECTRLNKSLNMNSTLTLFWYNENKRMKTNSNTKL